MVSSIVRAFFLLLPGSLLLLAPKLAQAAGEWHSALLPPGVVAPLGQGTPSSVVFFTPVAGQPLDGLITTHVAGTEGSVVPFQLPADAPPTWDPAAPSAFGKTVAGSAWQVVASGRRAIVSNGAFEVYVFDGSTWITRSKPGPIFNAITYDTQGADVALIGAANGFPQGTWQIVGGVIANTRSSMAPTQGLALSGTRALLLGGNGVYASSDGGASFTSTGLVASMPHVVAPPGAGAFWAVAAMGFYARFDDPAGTWTVALTRTPAGTENFVDIERLGTEAWVLQDEGTLHWQASGDSPIWFPQPGLYEPFATGLASARDLAVFGPRQAVAVGSDGPNNTGNAMIAWRNRAPLDPWPAGSTAAVDEGQPTTVTVRELDPDGDPTGVTWSACSTDARLTSSPPVTGPSWNLSTQDAICPGESFQVWCDVQVLEQGATSEGLASPTQRVTVTVNGVDVTAPLASLALSPATPAAPGAAMTATLTVSDDCSLAAPLASSTRWRLLQGGVPVAGFAQTTGLTWDFLAPDPGASPTAYRVEVSVTDEAGNPALAVIDFLVETVPVELGLACPASIVAGERFTATATVVRGSPTGFTWSLDDPAGLGAIVQSGAGSGAEAVISTDACGVLPRDQHLTITVAPEGPAGGAPASCAVEVLPGPARPTLSLEPPGDPIVWPLPATGGELQITPAVTFACATPTPLIFDLRALPAALLPPGASGGWVDQPAPAPLLLGATAAEVPGVLGARGVFEGPISLALRYLPGAWHDDPAYPPLVLSRTLRIVPEPQLETRVSLPDARELAPGEITALRVQVASDVPVSELSLDLATPGLTLVPGSRPEGLSACAAPSVQVARSERGLLLSIDALPAGCEVELTVMVRVGFGALAARLEACTWLEGAVPCAGEVRIAREGLLGCQSGAGPGGWNAGFIVLLIFCVPLAWRRRP